MPEAVMALNREGTVGGECLGGWRFSVECDRDYTEAGALSSVQTTLKY